MIQNTNNNTTQASPTLTEEEVRTLVAKELQLEGIPTEEQDILIADVANLLAETASVKVFNMVPEEYHEELSELAEDQEKMQARLKEIIPNVSEVVQQAMQEGLENYKKRVSEELANSPTAHLRAKATEGADSTKIPTSEK